MGIITLQNKDFLPRRESYYAFGVNFTMTGVASKSASDDDYQIHEFLF